MSSENYKRTIVVKSSPAQSFEALTQGIEHWWTKPDNKILNSGDRAKFTFPPGKSYWTFEALNLIPNELVELECVGAMHLHEGMPKEIETEWLGSVLRFTISQAGTGSEILFEHQGLKPQLHCFEVCEAGWDYFFVQSLAQYLETGTGMPHKC